MRSWQRRGHAGAAYRLMRGRILHRIKGGNWSCIGITSAGARRRQDDHDPEPGNQHRARKSCARSTCSISTCAVPACGIDVGASRPVSCRNTLPEIWRREDVLYETSVDNLVIAGNHDPVDGGLGAAGLDAAGRTAQVRSTTFARRTRSSRPAAGPQHRRSHRGRTTNRRAFSRGQRGHHTARWLGAGDRHAQRLHDRRSHPQPVDRGTRFRILRLLGAHVALHARPYPSLADRYGCIPRGIAGREHAALRRPGSRNVEAGLRHLQPPLRVHSGHQHGRVSWSVNRPSGATSPSTCRPAITQRPVGLFGSWRRRDSSQTSFCWASSCLAGTTLPRYSSSDAYRAEFAFFCLLVLVVFPGAHPADLTGRAHAASVQRRLDGCDGDSQARRIQRALLARLADCPECNTLRHGRIWHCVRVSTKRIPRPLPCESQGREIPAGSSRAAPIASLRLLQQFQRCRHDDADDGRSDNFFIAAIIDPISVGIYAFYNRLTLITSHLLPLRQFENVIQPVFFAVQAADADQKVPQYFSLLLNLNLVLQWPILAYATAYHAEIVQVVFGGKFIEHSWLLPVMVVFTTLNVVATPVTLVAQQEEKAGIMLVSKVFGIYNVIALLVLIPIMGVYGAAIASGSAAVMKNGFVWWHVRKRARWMNAGRALLAGLTLWLTVIVVCRALGASATRNANRQPLCWSIGGRVCWPATCPWPRN